MTETTSIPSGVATRYATALFELALDGSAVEETEAALGRLEAMIAESDDLKSLIKSPVFTSEDQLRAMAAVLDKAGIGGLTGNMVKLAARNRRLFSVPGMIKAFRQLAAEHRGEEAAEVSSAVALSAAQMADLAEALKGVTGKDVRLTAKVDPSLIGGLVVRLGSRMIDTSLKTKLNSLKMRMKEVG
ncbi:MAG TPA: F0F1 ATP synthase subunit delta [Hyphomicrobiales bacterium]|nr:F0F1 ATP synthase subunit delta [Kaistiaceae bacterium]HQF31946.1 F0F1 ATP synthase subunit delta [Hyphomicrobiales bacterium]